MYVHLAAAAAQHSGMTPGEDKFILGVPVALIGGTILAFVFRRHSVDIAVRTSIANPAESAE
jgi:hypothetical protein